ncbi:hypothetical protein BK121_03330 [Paenibacillus odorifer]|uniref:HNH endonuclease n=1 Tax=Paenibacillus odorifer TaxID=189426 RepID=UPI00096CD8C5|nr:HNH endonuclease [Paenibacillus odorifer]OMC75059.1 hypothetical protein BK121_03330 [Paenibacillus odorifer]
MPFNHGLSPGITINNEQICEIFKCSPQGGMRKSNSTNTLILVSDHTDAFYDDRWISDVFHYTGMGQTGNQSLTFMQNKTLNESDQNGVEVYLFEVFSDRVYTFSGQVLLAGGPYKEEQLDKNKSLREVWVFPLRLADSNTTYFVPCDVLEKLKARHEKQAKKLSDEELKKRAQKARGGQSQRQATITSFDRDAFVSEYAKRRARGICQLCDNPAPFINKQGKPYLETHHIQWLSRGGPDTIENTIALCPNCHKKMHIVDDHKDVLKLARVTTI